VFCFAARRPVPRRGSLELAFGHPRRFTRHRGRILQVSGSRYRKSFGKHHFDQTLVGHIAAVGFAFDGVQ